MFRIFKGGPLLQIYLPYKPTWPLVGWLVGRLICHYFLEGNGVQCSNRSFRYFLSTSHRRANSSAHHGVWKSRVVHGILQYKQINPRAKNYKYLLFMYTYISTISFLKSKWGSHSGISKYCELTCSLNPFHRVFISSNDSLQSSTMSLASQIKRKENIQMRSH